MLVKSWLIALLLLLAAFSAAQQPNSAAAPGQTEKTAGQAGPQPLDLNEAIARDVLEPLLAGIQTQNLNQVLSVFDQQSYPNFAEFRDQTRAFLDSYSAVRFRYKILQTSAPEEGRASVTCEADIDATPYDEGQVPLRRSTQIRLQLKQTPKGWRISDLTPSDFFAQ